MAKEMQILQRTMSCIIRRDLAFRAYRQHTGQLLTSALHKIRATRTKQLLTQHVKGGHRQILFTDEKFFPVQEIFNKQNDRVYVHSSKEATESGKSNTTQLM